MTLKEKTTRVQRIYRFAEEDLKKRLGISGDILDFDCIEYTVDHIWEVRTQEDVIDEEPGDVEPVPPVPSPKFLIDWLTEKIEKMMVDNPYEPSQKRS